MEGESADVEVNARDAVQMECAKSQFNETRLLANEMQSKQAFFFWQANLTLKKFIRIID